jgi:hypothetical protein
MTPLVLSLDYPPPRRLFVRTSMALRQVFCISSGSCVLECVREPKGLQYAPGTRARRLMRNAQVSAW